MREFKFRVWNKTLKKMMNQKDLEKTVKELCKNNYVTGMIIPQNQDGVVMQYTGLKDKHEVEIYEGDILKNNRNETYTVKISPSHGVYAQANEYTRKLIGSNPQAINKHYEVIGNIFEE